MIPNRAFFLAGLVVALVIGSCTCSSEPSNGEEAGKPKGAQTKKTDPAVRGLVITAEAGETTGKGETRPFVEPVLPEFVAGSLSQGAIAGEITAHVEEIRACYCAGQKAKPDMAGAITLMFQLGDDGAVTACDVRESALHHEPTDQCICDAILKWRFPKPRATGGVKILYTFVLQP